MKPGKQPAKPTGLGGKSKLRAAVRRMRRVHRGLDYLGDLGLAGAVGGMLSGRLGLTSIGAGTTLAAGRAMTMLDTRVLRMAVGRPALAARLRRKYARHPELRKWLFAIETIGPVPKGEREKLAKKLFKWWKWGRVEALSQVAREQRELRMEKKNGPSMSQGELVAAFREFGRLAGVSQEAMVKPLEGLREWLNEGGVQSERLVLRLTLPDGKDMLRIGVERTPKGFRIFNVPE